MALDKITAHIYFDDIKEFIEKGWKILLDNPPVKYDEGIDETFLLKKVIPSALEIVRGCLFIKSIYQSIIENDHMAMDVFHAAALFCDAFRWHTNFYHCPSYANILAVGELANIPLTPANIAAQDCRWWVPFKQCLIFCKGTDNPLQHLNINKPITEPDVVFMLAYQLTKRGIAWQR